jgi:cation diffusion facilitator family transporter
MSEQKTRNIEGFALWLSVGGYAGMAVAGLAFAALTQSGAILLDGAYSLLSFITTLLARQVAKLVEVPDSKNFQFGYAYFEPLMNTIRGLLIMTLVAFGIGSAVVALFNGGRPLKPGLALVYSVIIGVICITLSAVQRRYAKQTDSTLLKVDAKNWFIDGMLTIAVGVAFLIAFVLQSTAWERWVDCVDPIVVIVLGLVMARTGILIVLDNVGELLHVAPEQAIQDEVRQRCDGATEKLKLVNRDVRMIKVGRYFYVLIKLIVGEDFHCSGVADLDRIRDRISAALAGSHPRLVLDVVFTTDDRWILGLVDEQTEATGGK